MQIYLKDITVHISKDEELFKIPHLEIKSGEKLLIKGESGKGKTTFLHMLAGLFLPTLGEVTLGETSLNLLSEDERCLLRRKKIGLIFQKLNLIDHLTARENVYLLGGDEKEDYLSKVGLNNKDNTLVARLSLGEQQRVAIARVLASNFEIILADEPTSSLDSKNAKLVMEKLLEASLDKTLIVVSHDDRIEKFFTRIVDFEEIIS